MFCAASARFKCLGIKGNFSSGWKVSGLLLAERVASFVIIAGKCDADVVRDRVVVRNCEVCQFARAICLVPGAFGHLLCCNLWKSRTE